MPNAYLDEKSPWKVIKESKKEAGTYLYVALCAISSLKTAFYPFLPFSSRKVHEYLGFSGDVESAGWKRQDVPAGQELQKPQPLFTKLDEEIIEQEIARLGQGSQP